MELVDEQLSLKNINVNRIKVRRAKIDDLDEIYTVSCSVGNSNKNSSEGFLIDDYMSDPKKYKVKIAANILELDYFYVAETEDDRIVGYCMMYTKEQWLKRNIGWADEVFWHPEFNIYEVKNFVMVDKTAVLKGFTGIGIGSRLYAKIMPQLKKDKITDMLAETVIAPVPNLASMNFRNKQSYNVAGMRYEQHMGKVLTTLVYHKKVI